MASRVPRGYILRWVIYLMVVVWFAATVNFVLPRIAGRDPVLEQLSEMQASVGTSQAGVVAEAIDTYR